jgi:hypothetical protein
MPSRLINDLKTVPHIVGELGLSIATAQKALNEDYLNSIERLVALVHSLLGDPAVVNAPGDKKELAEFLQAILKQLAPSRYEFSETTLTVKLDLAQRIEGSADVGLGAAIGAATVNFAMSLAYAQDYRAAAECRVLLKAYPADSNALDKLNARAQEVSDKSLELPAVKGADKAILDKSSAIFEKLFGSKPVKPITERPAAP